jgi:hypothetical protein
MLRLADLSKKVHRIFIFFKSSLNWRGVFGLVGLTKIMRSISAIRLNRRLSWGALLGIFRRFYKRQPFLIASL